MNQVIHLEKKDSKYMIEPTEKKSKERDDA